MESKDIRLLINQLQAEKDSITTKVDAARRRAKETGEYADARWLTSAQHAGRMRGREIAKLQADLGDAVRAEKLARADANTKASDEKSVPFEREFMFQARSTLPRVLYELVLLQTVQATGEA